MSRDGQIWSPTFVLLTCEHAGREVPAAYRCLFKGARAVLDSHRGYDAGALGVALRMAPQLSAPILFTSATRLLVDTNRSLDHPQLFSEFACDLRPEERRRVIDTYYIPHRTSVETLVRAAVNAGHRVLHVGVHSFTDVLDEVVRNLDIALLFDPVRASEALICEHWSAALRSEAGDLRHRLNEPYQGIDDGLTSALRTKFAVHTYAGIEVEIRQALISRVRGQRAAADLLTATLRRLTQPLR